MNGLIFLNCLILKLTSFDFNELGFNSVTTVKRMFFGCINLQSVNFSDLNGDSIVDMSYWFYNCENLTGVTIGSGVTSIDKYAFQGCSSFTGSLTIPNSVTTIGEGAFAYCVSLESITIPNSVTTIGSGAFAYCESLESITIPSSVTTIGDHILYKCSDLQSVTFEGTPESIHENAFTYINYSDPIDLYLPEVWGGEPYISPTRPWYGGFFNMKQAPTKFYLGKEHPEDVVATLAADGTLTITGSGEMQDYVDDSDIAFSISLDNVAFFNDSLYASGFDKSSVISTFIQNKFVVIKTNKMIKKILFFTNSPLSL